MAGHWVDDALGFMAGWNFFFYEALLIPFEVTALNSVLGFGECKALRPVVHMLTSLYLVRTVPLNPPKSCRQAWTILKISRTDLTHLCNIFSKACTTVLSSIF